MAGQYLFAVGGEEDAAFSIDRYDFETDTWEFTENIGGPYYRPQLVVGLDGLLYFIGMEQVCTAAVCFSVLKSKA